MRTVVTTPSGRAGSLDSHGLTYGIKGSPRTLILSGSKTTMLPSERASWCGEGWRNYTESSVTACFNGPVPEAAPDVAAKRESTLLADRAFARSRWPRDRPSSQRACPLHPFKQPAKLDFQGFGEAPERRRSRIAKRSLDPRDVGCVDSCSPADLGLSQMPFDACPGDRASEEHKLILDRCPAAL